MKTRPLFIVSGLIILLIAGGCGSRSEIQEGNSQNVTADEPNSYKPAVFKEDRRKEKLFVIEPAIQQMIEDHIEERNIPGVAWGIVVDDNLFISGATGFRDLENNLPATTNTAFRIASMTKSFTAMAIMKLRDEGKLSLEDLAADYVPEMAGLEYLTVDSPPIRIRNLLSMTAGFPEDNPWGDRQLDEPDRMLRDLLETGISFSNPPAYTYEYSNTGYALLGLIIKQVSGMPYQDYIRENILKPLDMHQTYWEYENVPGDLLATGYRWEDEQWKEEPILHDGSYGAMGGLITTIEDFSKYVSFHLSAWPPRNDPDNGPLQRSTLREMHTPHFPRLYTNATDFNGEPCAIMTGYGYGLGIAEDCHGLLGVSHGGALPGYGSNYIFFPEYGIGLMAFGNLTYTSPYPRGSILELLFEEVDLKPRELPVSGILAERKQQVAELIQTWDEDLEAGILAENFYLDRSRANRMAEIQAVIEKAGKIISIGEMTPENQLRGAFDMEAKNGIIHVFFTLTPEKEPRVQYLEVTFESGEEQD